MQYARDGDTIVVWRLDRLSRSLKDLIEMVTLLESKGIGLKSLQEAIDTSSSSGKLIFHTKRREHVGAKAVGQNHSTRINRPWR